MEIVRKILQLFPEDLIDKFEKSHIEKNWDDKYDYEAILDLKHEILELSTYNTSPYDGEKNCKEIASFNEEFSKIFDEFNFDFNETKYGLI